MSKLPFVFKFKNMDRAVSSKNGKVRCWYTFIDEYVGCIIESIDRTFIKERCALFSNYEDMIDYLENISK